VLALDFVHRSVLALDFVHRPITALDFVHRPVSVLDFVHRPVLALDFVHRPVSVLDFVHRPVLVLDFVHSPALAQRFSVLCCIVRTHQNVRRANCWEVLCTCMQVNGFLAFVLETRRVLDVTAASPHMRCAGARQIVTMP
jgi:hypothetical protein